ASGPSPPERKVHPLRRKSQRPAKSTSGFFESIDRPEQPVERLPPLRISDQVLPPSPVLYTPRSALSLQSLPGTQAQTVLPSLGCTRMRAMRSDSGRPMWVHVSPASVLL